MKTTRKAIDQILSPALVKGGKQARSILALQLWRNRREPAAVAYIKKLATWTGYPNK